MQKNFFTLVSTAALAFLLTGCAGSQQKLGRGINNTWEVVRGGEFRKSVEQSALFDSPEESYTTGIIHGFNRSVGRTLLGVFEVATFPVPNHDGADYGPICTAYFSPKPVYPDNYTPNMIEDSTMATDTSLGFSGGDSAPMIPGSRFRIFDAN
jgi:putative exosortase-associated protein (TIGR04073 family)